MSKIKTEEIYDGPIFSVQRETHRMPDAREARFEIVKHPGGATALPLLDNGNLLLIRQFRPVVEDYIYEIPAGRLEQGETPEGCIARELIEEVGYRAGQIDPLGYIHSSVGFCSEKIHLFVARQLSKVDTALEADEFIEPVEMSLDEALALVEQGKLSDAKTQLTLLRYALQEGRR